MKTSLILAASLAFLPLSACGQEMSETETAEAAPAASSTPQPQQQAQTQENSSAIEAIIDKDGFEEIIWEDLMPEGEDERLQEMYAMQMQQLYSSNSTIAEGSAADKAVQIGTFNVVKELDGVEIKLPGYTVPFDYSPNAEIMEFLLVPYFGACLHAPPPPPNQTLYVKTEKPIRITDLAQAVWVRGTLTTERQNSELADTAYTLTLHDVTEYTY